MVGLTGGIASGKSTVTAALRNAGVEVIDADEVTHHVQRKGAWAYRRVVRQFGSRVLDGSGNIDRQKLGDIVFSDAAARRRLNQATHAPIAVEIGRRLLWAWLRGSGTVVLDMPLLYESGAYRVTRPVVVVSVPRETQVVRLMQRDSCSREGAEARVAAQMPLADKAARADIVVNNGGSREDTQEQAAQLAHTLRSSGKLTAMATSPVGVAVVGVAMLLRSLLTT